MKQTVEFRRDLSHQDLINCREAVEDIAESNNRFLAETESYIYPKLKATREPVGRIIRGEVTIAVNEVSDSQKDEDQSIARRVTSAPQLKCTGEGITHVFLLVKNSF